MAAQPHAGKGARETDAIAWLFGQVAQARPWYTPDTIASMTAPQAMAMIREDPASTIIKLGSVSEAAQYKRKRGT